MEWEKQEQMMQQQQQQNGVLYVKVMTDEQMEVLRRQISAYATICEQLVEMHKSIAAQQDLSGFKMGSIYCDTLMTANGHKITSRQRWTPTPVQLQILEHLFEQGNGTPSKQKIKEITTELIQHGQISETNVYNWFQNRRARSKRKQQATTANNTDSSETEDEYPMEKKGKPESNPSHENSALMPDELCFQSSDMNSELHSFAPSTNNAEAMFPLNGGSKSSVCLNHISFCESVLSNPRIDHLMGKMEVPGSFNPFGQEESYDMIG